MADHEIFEEPNFVLQKGAMLRFRSIQHTVRNTEISPARFKNFCGPIAKEQPIWQSHGRRDSGRLEFPKSATPRHSPCGERQPKSQPH